MILDDQYRPLSPAEIMKLHNADTIYVVRDAKELPMKDQPTNTNGHFSQIGKKPKGMKTPKRTTTSEGR